MVVTDRDLALLTPSTLITRYPSNKILFEPTGKGEPLNIELYKMSTHGELFVNSGKAYCAPMDGFCVPFSVKKESEFPAISAYGSYGGGYLFLILKIIVFLLPLFWVLAIIWYRIRLLKIYVIMELNGLIRNLSGHI